MNNENPIKGRGVYTNPKNRFETNENTFEDIDDYSQSSKTEIIKDASQSILSYNNSPDILYNEGPELSVEHFRNPNDNQTKLFFD